MVYCHRFEDHPKIGTSHVHVWFAVYREFVPVHTHDFAEMFVVIGDKVRQQHRGSDKLLRRGTVGLVPPHAVHCITSEERSSELALVNVVFEEELLLGILRRLSFFSEMAWKAGEIKHFELEETFLHGLINELSALPHCRENVEFELARIFCNLFYHLLHRQGENADHTPPWLTRAGIEIRKIENLRYGVRRFFKLCGRSADHVGRSCRDYYGRTPTELINAYKLQYVAEKLLLTDEKIDVLIASVGIRSVAHFYREFRTRYGLSPGRYRKKHRS